jgi:hypothetical protein
MPHPKDFVGIQNFRPMVNHQLLVMVSKHADIPDTCTECLSRDQFIRKAFEQDALEKRNSGFYKT